jgi:hypothetical protein
VDFNPFRYKDASTEYDTQPKGNKMNMTREALEEYLGQMGETPLLMDGFDEACIGFSQRINEPMLAVYKWQRMVQILKNRDKMSYEDAVEYIEYNCLGAWIGEQTPIIVMPIEL